MANTLLDAIQPFVWGPGGAKKTPDEIAKDRELAAAALLKAGNTAPVDHWTQGAARVADALAGVIRQRRAEAAGAENAQYNSSLISNILGGNAASDASSSGTMPSPAASGEIAATSPSQPIDMTGNDVYSGFMDTVKAGGVTNPYALAAIAATGKAESGFSPGNVNRTWSDPSESGQAGTAGGILSWRGPRYQALAATGDLSPAGQAKFFLGENPQLIQSLQNAKSVEEAQSLMNGAWKFSGYNRPGGESARRLGYANSFLPTFQGGGEVASVDPQSAFNAAMPELNAGIPANADPIMRQNMTVPSLSDEVAEFRGTPEFMERYPNGYEQPLSDQQFNDRFGGEQQTLPVAAAEVAQQPVQQAQATPVQVAQASQGQSAAVNEAIIRAISDPRATQETKAIAQALLQQQLSQQEAERAQRAQRDNWLFQQQYQEQAQARDPLRQAQIEKLQREASNPGSDENFFGNPVAIQNPDGSISYGQIGNKGSFKPIQLGEGQTFAPPTKTIDGGTENLIVDQAGNVISRVPKDLAGAESEKIKGKAQGEAEVNLPALLQQGDYALSVIDQAINHPGRETYTGASSMWDPRNYMMGTDAADYDALQKQMEGQAFLDAFESLKGGGQITEVEGAKATQARARLARAQSDKAYLDALNELREVVQSGLNRARQKAGGGATSTGSRLRFNPATGELE